MNKFDLNVQCEEFWETEEFQLMMQIEEEEALQADQQLQELAYNRGWI